MKRTVILAGDHKQYKNFIIGNHMDEDKYFYGGVPQNLFGQELRDIITIGTFFERKDANKMLELAKTRIRK